jgi:hypothetical protein
VSRIVTGAEISGNKKQEAGLRNKERKKREERKKERYLLDLNAATPFVIRVILIADKVFTHNWETGKTSALIQC